MNLMTPQNIGNSRGKLMRHRRPLALFCVVALAGSLLAPVPASAQHDGGAPDPQVVSAVWGYARETGKGYDHVLRWMRVLKTFGALTDMTAADAQDKAEQFTGARWNPVVAELTKLETQAGYQPDSQVVSAVRGYAKETGHGFDHVLRWMRVLKSFGALEDMSAADARGFADRGSGWERWVPVADELAELEGGAPGDQVDEPAPAVDPVFADGAAVSFSIAEDHAGGASVGTVAATDGDGDALTYWLWGADAASFAIDASSGEITVASGVQLDFEAQSSHSVTVGVSDGNDDDGSPEARATVDAMIAVTIEVTDAPGDQDGPRRGRRNAGEGVRGTQEDGATGAQAPTLPTGCGADFPTTTEWFASITGTTTSFTVTFVNPVPTGVSFGTSICGPHGTGDAYTVNHGNFGLGNVNVGANGDARTVTRFNGTDLLKPNTDYWIRISSSYPADANLRSAWTHAHTAAATTPTAPTFTDGASTTLSISESHTDGQSVGTVGATDADGDTLTYSFAPSGTDRNSFSLSTSTGEISLASGVELDFETKSRYSLTLRVTDGKDSSGNEQAVPTIDDTIAVTIDVTDVPDITLTLADATSNPLSSLSEGAGSTPITVTATLDDGAHTANLSVPLSLAGTATSGSGNDYTFTPSTLPTISITQGSTTGTATVNIDPRDDADSTDETIEVTATVAGFEVTPAVITLDDDDLPPITLSSATAVIDEHATGGSRVTVTASVAQNVASRVDLTLTFGGSADRDTDYTVTNPVAPAITIPNGQNTGSVTFSLAPLQDRLDEDPDENIVIGASHADYSVTSHTITLRDDDEPSTGVTLRLSHTRLEENDAKTTVTVTAELNAGTLGSPVTVTFGTLSGEAMGGGTDYTSTDVSSGSAKNTPTAVTIAAGQTEASTTIDIAPNDDNLDEGTGENIQFTATLSGALTSTVSPVTLRIRDDDTASTTVRLSTSPTAVDEGHSGEATVTVTATVPGGKTHTSPIVVPVRVVAPTSPKRGATASASASSGDYRLRNFAGTLVSNASLPISLGSITIPAGMSSASRSFRVDPRDDTDFEGTETDAHEHIGIGAGTVAGFTVETADLQITENDNPTITLSVDTSTDAGVQTSLPEAAGTRSVAITMTLDDGARSSPTTVNIRFGGMATSGASCTAGTDFVVGNRAQSIPANTASRTFNVSIQVCQDRVTETSANETITINGTASGFDVTGTAVTIEDDDTESTSLTITATPSPISEGHTGTRTVTVKATLDGGTVSSAVTVTFDAMTGGAARGADDSTGDYTSTPAKPASITIPSGSLSASTTISIDPRDDLIDEDDETIIFDGSAAKSGGGTLSVTAGTVTITDNDTARVTLAVDTDINTPGKQTSLGEGAGATTVRVTATLTLERSSATDLSFRIAGGTASRTGDRKDYDASTSLTDATVDITIAAGSTTGSADVTITPVQERFDDGNKTVIIGLGVSGGLGVTDDSLTIVDDDSPSRSVTLSVDKTSIGEGDEPQTVVVTATLDDAVRSSATIVMLTFGGTAERGSAKDYGTSGTLSVTIPANEVSGQRAITITPVQERIDDGNKTIIVGGDRPTGTSLNVTAASAITLLDNDDAPTAITLTVSPTSLREQGRAGGSDCKTSRAGCASVEITASFSGANSDVTLVSDTTVALSVHSSSTATRGGSHDYTAPSALGDGGADITIDEGQTSASTTVEFTSIQDDISEGDETIVITAAVNNGFTVAAGDRATITLTDDDSASFSITLRFFECIEWHSPDPLRPGYCDDGFRPFGTVSIDEGTSDATLIIEAELDGKVSSNPTDVTLSLLMPAGENNATRGNQEDYTASDNLTDTTVDITIPATKQRAMTTVTLSARKDQIDDGFVRDGGAGVEGEIIRIGGTATNSISLVRFTDLVIRDFEEASTRISLTRSGGLDSFTEDHGAGVTYQIVATLQGDITRAVDTPVSLSLGGDAALGTNCTTAGIDYTVSFSSTVITIAAETKTADATVTLTPCDDDIPELSKNINVGGTADFGGDTGVVAVASGFAVNLVDDDLPIVTLSTERVRPSGDDESLLEGTSATFRIVAARDTAQTTQPVVVTLSVLEASTATSGTDYGRLSPGSITIPENEASAERTITVSTRDDQFAEDPETILIGGQVGDGTEFTVDTATLTISDNDQPSTEIQLSVNPASLAERAGARSVTVTAQLDGAPLPDDDIELTLELGGAGSTATVGEGNDYTLGSTGAVTITIPAGQRRATERITVNPIPDIVDEGDSETITVTGRVTSTGGSTLSVVGTHIDIDDRDDAASTIIELVTELSMTNAEGERVVIDSIPEDNPEDGSATPTVTVTLTATLRGDKAHDTDTTVTLAESLGGTATNADYAHTYGAVAKTIMIPVGSLSADPVTFTITPSADTAQEGAETIEVTGTAAGTPGLVVRGATLVIDDNDIVDDAGRSLLPGPVTLNTPRRQPESTEATLSWNAPARPPDPAAGRPGGYVVEQRSLTDGASSQWTQIADIAANPRRYEHPVTGLGADHLYEWRVTAYITALPDYDDDGRLQDADDDGIIDTIDLPCDKCAATPSDPKTTSARTSPATGGFFGGGGSTGGGAGGGGGRSPAEDDCRAELGPGTVIVANGWSAADVSVAATLAARLPGAVVLYSAAGGLPDHVEDLLCEHRPRRVIVVGGTAALSDAVVRQARSAATDTAIERIAGTTRVDTAAAAARRVLGDPALQVQRTLVIANGWSAPDSGVAAALAVRTPNAAVLYTAADELPEATAAVIEEYRPLRIVIVGGTTAVSAEAAAAVSAAAPAIEVERLEGATRTDTAAAAARRALGSPAQAVRRTLVVANGWSPPDIGIAAAVAARTTGSAVLYAARGELSDATAKLLADYRPARVVIVGGTSAVPDTVRGAIAAAAPTARIERIDGATRTHTAANAAQRSLPAP